MDAEALETENTHSPANTSHTNIIHIGRIVIREGKTQPARIPKTQKGNKRIRMDIYHQ